jgi:hypothetical protein
MEGGKQGATTFQVNMILRASNILLSTNLIIIIFQVLWKDKVHEFPFPPGWKLAEVKVLSFLFAISMKLGINIFPSAGADLFCDCN